MQPLFVIQCGEVRSTDATAIVLKIVEAALFADETRTVVCHREEMRRRLVALGTVEGNGDWDHRDSSSGVSSSPKNGVSSVRCTAAIWAHNASISAWCGA